MCNVNGATFRSAAVFGNEMFGVRFNAALVRVMHALVVVMHQLPPTPRSMLAKLAPLVNTRLMDR